MNVESIRRLVDASSALYRKLVDSPLRPLLEKEPVITEFGEAIALVTMELQQADQHAAKVEQQILEQSTNRPQKFVQGMTLAPGECAVIDLDDNEQNEEKKATS